VPLGHVPTLIDDQSTQLKTGIELSYPNVLNEQSAAPPFQPSKQEQVFPTPQKPWPEHEFGHLASSVIKARSSCTTNCSQLYFMFNKRNVYMVTTIMDAFSIQRIDKFYFLS
jgi:hypothetical protein